MRLKGILLTHVPCLLPGFIKAEVVRSAGGHGAGLTAGERTPTRPKASDRITLGSHGNSAFQPITASCKIVPQAQHPSPAESPGKSFQPITMSCKIVSGNCLQPVHFGHFTMFLRDFLQHILYLFSLTMGHFIKLDFVIQS